MFANLSISHMLHTVLPVQCVPLDSPCDSVTAQARAVGLNQLGYRKSLASSIEVVLTTGPQ